MKSMHITRYEATQHRAVWDAGVRRASNGLFMFERAFMDYHADRFVDYSLLFWEQGQLVALLPAHLTAEGILASHDGLTFGSFLWFPEVSLSTLLACFEALCQFGKQQGWQGVRYKTIPFFYHRKAAQADSYALFLQQATFVDVQPNVVIRLREGLHFTKRKERSVRKAQKNGLVYRENQADWAGYWADILIPNLANRYERKPVHSAAEIQLLREAFPLNIRLFEAHCPEQGLCAGIVIFENPPVAHAQYIAASTVGKQKAALDGLLFFLLQEVYNDFAYFSLGIVTDQAGKLNEGLLAWKEGWGGGIVPNYHSFISLK
ncbi:MAG TPA: GNAT family N-acetyltransferase [Microscillaceae bacterium]|nr:GNAT family N-acetyltransferase [Microscillaceae bacterium]